jgi:glucose-6-phosphate isomerase
MISVRGRATSKIDRFDPRYQALAAASRRLAVKDSTLWGEDAAAEASKRLNWVDLPLSSRTLLPELDALSAKFRGCSRVILCGMGGSSLAPEVIAASFGRELFVLDSTDPSHISRAIKGDFSTTVVVVSSKSGSTVETASQRALFESLILLAGLDPVEHMVIVTDPNSPLDIDSRNRGFSVINADPNVGGRFSALTAFGLVPSALLGIDVSVLLDSALELLPELAGGNSSAVDIAYLISYFSDQYCAFSDSDSGMVGLADWIEQLIAESTGKGGVGRLPIVIESNDAPVGGDAIIIAFSGNSDIVINGELGSQFIFWEWVASLIGFALQIDPFNQPNVTEAKEKTAELLAAWSGKQPQLKPSNIDGTVSIFADAKTTQSVLESVLNSVTSDGYIAIMAYLDRQSEVELGELRQILAEKSGRPVTFGWGPRFLHSTGQFHKGGQQNGVFLQITGDSSHDFEIPGKNFSFGTLIAAQALGDGEALSSRGRPVLRLHLKNRKEGISEILAAARAII